MVLPVTQYEHEGDTLAEHEFVNVLSPWSALATTTALGGGPRIWIRLLGSHLSDGGSGGRLVHYGLALGEGGHEGLDGQVVDGPG